MAKLYKNLMGDGSLIDISCINIPTLTVGGTAADNETLAKTAVNHCIGSKVNIFGFFQANQMGFIVCISHYNKSIISGLIYRHGYLVRRFNLNSGAYTETLIRES